MKAVMITAAGGPEVLEVREVETPPAPVGKRVRVRVRAAAINRADILQRRGFYPAPADVPVDIPGMEFAGEVDALGPDAKLWKEGQRVFGITGGGAQAEFVVVREDLLAEIPSHLDWESAAAVPEVFVTAHDALFTRARFQSGETVLIHAAGSGVGTAASQLVQAAGGTAYGTSRSSGKLKQASEFGLANSVVVEDPNVIAASVASWTGGRGVDVILDLVGAPYLEANLRSLAMKGRMILIGTTGGSKANLDYGLVMSKRLTIVGTVLRPRSDDEKSAAMRLFADHVVPLLASGEVKPVIDRVYKLDQVREAHARMEANENFGKIVLVMQG